MSGTATLKVSAQRPRKPPLKRRRWRADGPLHGRGHRTVTLKPSAAVRRALAKARGSVKATLDVSLCRQVGLADGHAHALNSKRARPC